MLSAKCDDFLSRKHRMLEFGGPIVLCPFASKISISSGEGQAITKFRKDGVDGGRTKLDDATNTAQERLRATSHCSA